MLEIESPNITFHFKSFAKGLCTEMLCIGNFKKCSNESSSELLYCLLYVILLPIKPTCWIALETKLDHYTCVTARLALECCFEDDVHVLS